jgi:hypothetical protein
LAKKISPTSEALGRGKKLTFAGKTWNILPCDFNDLADIEDTYGTLAVDYSKVKNQRYLIWIALRKADPSLSAEQRENFEYRLTETQVGQMLSADRGLAEVMEFAREVLQISGLIPKAEDDIKNDQTPEES